MANHSAVASIYRYPVKGFSPEKLGSAALAKGAYFPGDRLYAVENGPAGFDENAPVHQPKIKYLMLMRQERLARLKTSYDDAAHTLTIRQGGAVAASGDLRTAQGRAAIEAFLKSYMGDELRGPPRILAAPGGYRFTDSRSGFVSLINLASVQAIADNAGRESIDPLRFRGNIMIDGWDAWSELELSGKYIRIGAALLRGIKPIERCAATNVDPSAGIRDLRIPELIDRMHGHRDCGLYCEVIDGGVIRPCDSVSVV